METDPGYQISSCHSRSQMTSTKKDNGQNLGSNTRGTYAYPR